MDSYFYLKDEKTRKLLLKWWESLKEKNGRADRARLRRAESPNDVLLTESFFRFLRLMPSGWSEPVNLPASALVAAILAHVNERHEDKSFAKQLASPKMLSDRPRMSILRFQQLQKSRDPDEFFRRMLKAVRLAESPINIFSLADSILHWMKEYTYGVTRKPINRLSVRWATDYYLALPK